MKRLPKPSTAESGEAEFWAEDAERVNKMGEMARRLGLAVGRSVTPPPLNPDGSLKHPDGEDWTPVNKKRKG